MTDLRIDHPLAGLIQAKRVALLGASERVAFSALAARNLIGLGNPFYPVNPGGKPVFGQQGYASCNDIGEPVDAAFITVPQPAVKEVMLDALSAGIRNFVLCSSGYAETSSAGAALQQELVDLCSAHDAIMMGPNCIGFSNYVDQVSVGTASYAPIDREPTVALICGSGLISGRLDQYLRERGGAPTHLFAVGNEAMVDAGLIASYLLMDPRVQAIAMFLEAVRKPEAFEAMAAYAAEVGKPIVVLKAGASEQTAAVAAAHTGALVGDDNVFSAVCERYGIMRARSIEDLITTAQVAGYTGKLKKPGVAFVSHSGGACVLISDRASEVGLDVPQFAPETVAQLEQVLTLDFGHAFNPLDLTGAAVKDPSLYEAAMAIVDKDPQIGLTVCHYDVAPSEIEANRRTLPAAARAALQCSLPAPLLSSSVIQYDEAQRKLLQDNGVPMVFSGIEHGVGALAKIALWSQTQPAALRKQPSAFSPARPRSERETLNYLKEFGVPVIPAVVATSAEAAVAAARDLDGPVVLKILSPDIAHKTEVGGVKLNLLGDDAVSAGFEAIMSSVLAKAPAAQLDGIVVSPMREGGLDLIVGITRDPQWGLVLAVGLGGIWVEALKDVRLKLLPATRGDVLDALSGLRAKKLLEGFRGQPPVDREVLADIVVRIGEAAQALGPELASLEINPLFVQGDRMEALDALAVWDNQAMPKA